MSEQVEVEPAEVPDNPAATMSMDIEALVKSQVASAVADAIASALPAVLTELAAKTPNFGNVPSPVVHMSYVPTATHEKTYKKHYRWDDTPSAKLVQFDMDRVKSGEDPNYCVLKGQWIHFKDSHFYATTDNEVEMIEYIRALPREKYGHPEIYEDDDTSIPLLCPVDGCGKYFGSGKTLAGHMTATHGLDTSNAQFDSLRA
jgi:hypothetical protein